MDQFFDINQLPKDEGLIIFGISMSKIGNSQSPAKCFAYLENIDTKIVKTEGIGMVFCYGDYLYFNSEEKAVTLKDRYKELMFSHKDGFLNLISKNNNWIKKAFSFYTFGQLMLENSEVYKPALDTVLNLYRTNADFKKSVDSDCLEVSSELSDIGLMFILEEITAFYLAAKGQLSFNNRFISGTEKWILQMYPGKPLKSEIHLFQLNPLKLSNPKNKFENHFYDLESKILYDYQKIDINNYLI